MMSCCFSVAKKILKKKNHTVVLGSGPQEYRVTVEARPVQLVVPKRMEVQTGPPPAGLHPSAR